MPTDRKSWMLRQNVQQALYPHLHELVLCGHTLQGLYLLTKDITSTNAEHQAVCYPEALGDGVASGSTRLKDPASSLSM